MTINRRDLLISGSSAAAAAAAIATSSIASVEPATAQIASLPSVWDREADVVVIGAGACGTCAAIVAREAGSSVMMLEAESHIGGHAITSGGKSPWAGTSLQKKYGIEDSPDFVFRDLTDWSVVEPNGFPDYRYNDREIIHAFADNSPQTFEWLVAHGVVFLDKAPDGVGGNSVGNSVPREAHCGSHGLARGSDGKAGRSSSAQDHVIGQWPNAAAWSGGQEGGR